MRDSMVFYRSFYEALKNLPPEQFKESVKALMEYGLNGEEPETSGIEKTIFLLAKAQIDANNKRYLNGTKGGRKVKSSEPDKNQSLTKQEPKPNQTRTKAEPNVNDNVNVNEMKKIYISRARENPCGYSRISGRHTLNGPHGCLPSRLMYSCFRRQRR